MSLLQLQLTALLFFALFQYGESVKLRVRSDGDTILDSEITFYAWLESPDKDTYEIDWTENYPKAGKRRSQWGNLDKSNDYHSNFTLPYKSVEGYIPGRYTVTVTVTWFAFIYYVNIDTKVIHYKISPTFEGEILVNQTDVPKETPTYISTKKEVEFNIHIHDASKFLDTALSVNYTWSINNTVVANTTIPKLITNITHEGDCSIQANLTAEFNSTKNGTSVMLMKNGTFALNVTAKAPIINFGYTGATWFRHGKLLDLKVSCEGSPPYSYCYYIIGGQYNHTGNETCISPSLTTDCEFSVRRYLGETGLYTLLILMKNDVSSFVNQSSVNVYNATHKPQLSIIVVPITCSVVAIVLIIFGVAYYWENHVRYTVEVADFDFGDSAEITQVTIIDRIRDTIYTWTSRRGETLILTNEEAYTGS